MTLYDKEISDRKLQVQVGHPVVKTLAADGASGSIRDRGCRSRQAANT